MTERFRFGRPIRQSTNDDTSWTTNANTSYTMNETKPQFQRFIPNTIGTLIVYLILILVIIFLVWFGFYIFNIKKKNDQKKQLVKNLHSTVETEIAKDEDFEFGKKKIN